MIKISIIVPVYNTEIYIERCLESIICQNFKDIEIIIINDASTDNSLEKIKKFLLKDKRIKLINKEKNEGLSSARNSGIKISKGEYILHIDSDDWIEQNYLQTMYESAIREEADIVISDFFIDFDNGKKIYFRDQIENNKIKCIENIFLNKSFPSVWNKLIKRSLYIENNIWHPEDISLGEDLAVIPKILYFSKKISIINKAYLHYIKNYNSITNSKYNLSKIKQINKAILINESFFYKKKIKYLKELRVNHLLICLFQIDKEDRNRKYLKKVDELLKLIKEVDLKNIYSIKRKIIIFLLKYFNSKKTFLILKKVFFIFNR